MATTTGTRTVEDVLREGGLTPFHRKVVLVTGFSWTFVAFEIIMISLVVTPVLLSFGVTTDNNAVLAGLVAAATLIGSFLGSLFLGRLSDAIGRRRIFLASILWYSVFTAATALSWDPWSVFGFRLLAGVGLGGMLVVDPAVLSELLPPQSRGRYMVLLDFFWPLGFLLAIAFWWVFIIQGVTIGGIESWRLLFVVAAFPAFIAALARLAIPESPFYYARHGRLSESASVLSKITARTVDPASLAAEQAVPRAPISALFGEKLARRSVVTMVTWMALNFSYYGLFLWLPTILPKFGVRELDPLVSGFGFLALFLVVSALTQFPGYLASMVLVERWGRKKTLALFLILGGVSGIVFATATSFLAVLVSLAFVGFFNLGAWGAVYAYTPELFPTQYRATGFGMAEGVGKLTSIAGPVLFGALFAYTGGIVEPLSLIAVVMVIGGLFLAGVGPETKGQTFE
jgi:putative MFS transporter